ncbi:MAG: hypothetical protein MZW92_07100 [Comamonadaceae bacterium]|nr:hypothetical protein [Comamonadaceae bacterium]
MTEDIASGANRGMTVSALFAPRFADVDSGSALGGIVVVGDASNGTQGAWQVLDRRRHHLVRRRLGKPGVGPGAVGLGAAALRARGRLERHPRQLDGARRRQRLRRRLLERRDPRHLRHHQRRGHLGCLGRLGARSRPA